jgi:hypothetical protein
MKNVPESSIEQAENTEKSMYELCETNFVIKSEMIHVDLKEKSLKMLAGE